MAHVERSVRRGFWSSLRERLLAATQAGLEPPVRPRAVSREEDLAVVLSEFARTLVTDFPIQGILDHLVQRIVDVLPIDAAGVTLFDDIGLRPHYMAASDDSALRFEQLQSELGEGPCTAAYQLGEAIMVPDLRTDTRFPKFGPLAIDAGLGAVFTFPLRQGDHPALGALDLYRLQPGAMNPSEIAAAQTLADVTAAYLLNARARSALRDSALHDALTGLPNRTLLADRLLVLGARAGRYGYAYAVLFCDLDRFKEVNDAYGHVIGDQVLIQIARRLEGVVRPTDTAVRLAGDEFVIACESQADEEGMRAAAVLIAERVTRVVAAPIPVTGGIVELGVSIGVAVFTTPVDVDVALHHSDRAMYVAKSQGGGVKVYSPSDDG